MNTQLVWQDIRKIRAEAPLIHNITNYVVMNQTANALLALGASPVMAHAPEEVEEMASIARALVLNIGTLSTGWIDSMLLAARTAAARGIPTVLDPVGCGATRFRTETAMRLMEEAPPAVIRGNASEVMALYRAGTTTKGVDSTRTPEEALDAGRCIAEQYGCVVSISGETDFVVDHDVVIRIHGGHPIMPKVTGMGCTATALTGAFAAVNRSRLQAAVHAMATMAAAGAIAGEQSAGPGGFPSRFLDALYGLDQAGLEKNVRLEQLG